MTTPGLLCSGREPEGPLGAHGESLKGRLLASLLALELRLLRRIQRRFPLLHHRLSLRVGLVEVYVIAGDRAMKPSGAPGFGVGLHGCCSP